jgi:hypothetical protein
LTWGTCPNHPFPEVFENDFCKINYVIGLKKFGCRMCRGISTPSKADLSARLARRHPLT